MNSPGDDLANGALGLPGGAIDLKPLRGVTSFPFSAVPVSLKRSIGIMHRIYAKLKGRYENTQKNNESLHEHMKFKQTKEEEVAGYKEFLALRSPEAK